MGWTLICLPSIATFRPFFDGILGKILHLLWWFSAFGQSSVVVIGQILSKLSNHLVSLILPSKLGMVIIPASERMLKVIGSHPCILLQRIWKSGLWDILKSNNFLHLKLQVQDAESEEPCDKLEENCSTEGKSVAQSIEHSQGIWVRIIAWLRLRFN